MKKNFLYHAEFQKTLNAPVTIRASVKNMKTRQHVAELTLRVDTRHHKNFYKMFEAAFDSACKNSVLV